MKRSLRSWLWSVPLEQEVDEELAFHREMRGRESIDGRPQKRVEADLQGGPGEQAKVEADLQVGLRRTLIDIGRKRDREMRLTQWLQDLRRDVTVTLRQLRRAPGFTAVATLTLAIGIGANSAMFALVDAAFLRPLPFQAPPDHLVMLWDRAANGARLLASPLDYLDWSEQNHSFATLAAMTVGSGVMTLGEDPTPVAGRSVTFHFFDVLGVTPIAGRTFTAADTVAPSTVVIGEAFWRRRLGGNPSAIGQTLTIGGQPLTIVGILPAAFQFAPPGGGDASAGATDVWLLFNPPRAAPPYLRSSHFIWVIGRLRDGVAADAARRDLAALASRQGERFPATHANRQIEMEPLREALIGREVRTTSLLLLGVVGFVLLMCCANVASLVLARSNARAGEIAVRSALGAGRRRIVTQLLAEGLVLATLGAAAGAMLGAAILRGTPPVIPAGLLPNAVTLAFDQRVVAFCAGSALLVAVAFGLAPAWQMTRTSIVESLAQNTRITRRGGLGSVLVAGQIAVTVLVLCGSGLLLRTLLTLGAENPGFTANDAVTLVVNLPFPNQAVRPEARGPYGTEDGIQRYFDQVRDEVSRVPGVQQVAWGGAMPLDGYWTSQPFEIAGDPPRDVQDRDLASYHMVSAAYFATLGIPLLAGRGFTDADTRPGRPVCIVTDAFVRRYLHGRSPLGQRVVISRMAFAAEPPAEREIVGVVRQVISSPGEASPVPHVYVPQAQNAWWSGTLVVKPAGITVDTLIPGIRDALTRVDRQLRPTRIRTMDEIARASTARPRFRALLVAAFALLALALASVGVFGMLTQTVQQKTHELAVRVALGARGKDIIRIVGSHTAMVAAMGLAIGLALAAVFTRWLTTLLYGVSPLDPLTFVTVFAVLAGTAVLAASAPARRALRIEPAATFRQV